MKKRQLSVSSAESRPGRFQSSSVHSALCPFYDFQKYYLRKWGHFRHPGKSLIAPKSHVWGTTRTLTLEKCLPWGGSRKTWKFDEKIMRKWEVFDGSEPRLALYSSLITHFRHFPKKTKSMPKDTPKGWLFGPKPGRASVDWFCDLGRFWVMSENLNFSISL